MFESSGGVGCLVSTAPPRGLGSEPGTVIASLADAPGSSGALALLAAIDPRT